MAESERTTLDVHPLMLRGLMIAVVAPAIGIVIDTLIRRSYDSAALWKDAIFMFGAGFGGAFSWAWRPDSPRLPRKPVATSDEPRTRRQWLAEEERIDLLIVLARFLSFAGLVAAFVIHRL
ncbi:MAG TPA: hypothetical protein ENI86_16420 [Acidimicrobiales bacterium]|nr:hypothetical protein [Acidimicrobiales bacterium]